MHLIKFSAVLTALENPFHRGFKAAQAILKELLSPLHLYPKDTVLTMGDINLEFDVDVVIRLRRDLEERKQNELVSEQADELTNYAINTFLSKIIGEGGYSTIKRSEFQYHWDGEKLTKSVKPNKALREPIDKNTSKAPPAKAIQKLMEELLGGRTYFIGNTDISIIPFKTGESLFDIVSDSKRDLSSERILKISIEFFQHLLYTKVAKIAHLDIKLENILLDGDRVNLIDWGFAASYSGSVCLRGSLPYIPSQVYTENDYRQLIHYQDIFAALILIFALNFKNFIILGDLIEDIEDEQKNPHPMRRMQAFQLQFIEFAQNLPSSPLKDIALKILGPAEDILKIPSPHPVAKITAADVLNLLQKHDSEQYQRLFKELLQEDLEQYEIKNPHSPLSPKLIYQIFLWATEGEYEKVGKIWETYKIALKNKEDNMVTTINTLAREAFESPQTFNIDILLNELHPPTYLDTFVEKFSFWSKSEPQLLQPEPNPPRSWCPCNIL